MPTSQTKNPNKGKPNSIKQASILFYPNLTPKPTTNTAAPTGVYSHNVNRQRTFTSYYSSLEAQKKPPVLNSHYQNQMGVRPIPTAICQPNFLSTLKYNSNTFEQFDSQSDYFDEKSLMSIKENYNRSIAGLGESLDLFNVTSSAANRILSSSNRGSLLNMDQCPKQRDGLTSSKSYGRRFAA